LSEDITNGERKVGTDIVNCTIVDNTAIIEAGGLRNCDGTTTITNCIIWGNDPCQLVDSSTPTYSCFPDASGNNNINSDPCFVDSANDDYHIQPISPCIDEGDPCGTYTGQDDIDGDDRVIDIGGEGDGNVDVDMGADEVLPVPLQANSPSPVDSTTGVNIDADLSWTAGLYAELHDVYLGQSYDAVLNATKASAEYKGTQSSTTYDHPVSFDYATTYYWRIDEVNSTGTTTGNVWSFTTCYDHCFVDNSGSPSWPNVFTDIHSALNAVCESGVIWVADGTYTITSSILIFESQEGVSIYGGFAGYENPDTFDLDDRNFTTNETIIDGDNAENFACVDILGYDCTIDGFTIKNAGSSTQYGIGIACYDVSSATTIANCKIANNGKGISIFSCTSPMITDCTFSENGFYDGYFYAGGGMGIDSSSPTVSNCEFKNNIPGGLGISWDSSPTISNCVFNGNVNSNVLGNGGGINISLLPDYSDITIEDCIFINNTAKRGGGIHIDLNNSYSDLEIRNCVFYQNNATDTDAAGGGLYAGNGTATGLELFNCLFISNGNSSSKGGAIACMNNCSLEAVNCTFYGNIASQGGTVYSATIGTSFGGTDLINCILWGNTATSGHEVYCNNSGFYSNTITLEYCDIQNTTGWMREDPDNKAYVDWENNDNIYDNPLFDSPSVPKGTDGIFRTSDDGFALTSSSECRNTGDNVTGYPYYLSEDITNGERKIDVVVDRGAYEYGN